MDRRLILSTKLHEVCGHVYFQPPATIKMVYPCIVYKLENFDPLRANNNIYVNHERYTVTVIDRNPDSEIPYKVAAIPYSKMTRTFENENLHHWVFTIYV